MPISSLSIASPAASRWFERKCRCRLYKPWPKCLRCHRNMTLNRSELDPEKPHRSPFECQYCPERKAPDYVPPTKLT
jgi:hypothetical protein